MIEHIFNLGRAQQLLIFSSYYIIDALFKVAQTLHCLLLSFSKPVLLLLPLPTDVVEMRRFPSSLSTSFHFLTGAGLGVATGLTGSKEERWLAPLAVAVAVAETRIFCVGATVLLSKDLVLVCPALFAVAGEAGFLV